MAIACVCGHAFDLNVVPSDDRWNLIQDHTLERFMDKGVDLEFLRALTPAAKCPMCDRLWVFWSGLGEAATEYVQHVDSDTVSQ
jgi:hypothetical protein